MNKKVNLAGLEIQSIDPRPDDDAGGQSNAEADKKHELFLDAITLTGAILSFLILVAIIYFLNSL